MTVLGIDIGGTRIKAGLVDENGAVVEHRSVDTPLTLDAFRESLVRLVGEFRRGRPAAAGIGCKGIVEFESTRVLALPGDMHYLEGHRLSELAGLDVPARADNDARVAMAGEMMWGAARRRRNALLLTLGTGVGGAILAEGALVRGAGGVAGHLGHMTIEPEGPVCCCGNRGCLETIFSARAIEADAFRAGLGREVTCEAVFRRAGEGDVVAREIRDRAVGALAAGLAGLLHIFDPEVVILSGQIAEAGEDLFRPLARELERRTQCLLRRQVPLVGPGCQDRSGVAGAAALVSGHFFGATSFSTG